MKLPPGKYFIGDPYHIIREDMWNDYLNESIKSNNGFFKFKGVPVFASKTSNGEGLYEDEDYMGFFCTDTGMIGATPLDNGITDEDIDDLSGEVLFFDDDFECIGLDDQGIIYIAKFTIDTKHNEYN